MRSTVVSLLGNLPPHLYDANVMSTGQNVASLMYVPIASRQGPKSARQQKNSTDLDLA